MDLQKHKDWIEPILGEASGLILGITRNESFEEEQFLVELLIPEEHIHIDKHTDKICSELKMILFPPK